MAVEVEIDVAFLKSEIKRTYASVSAEPDRDFVFPTGRAWAEDLQYPAELAGVPDAAVESFAGVANPWELGRLSPGERVLDLGSGAGTDSLVAAKMVGPEGRVTGIDMTPEMLANDLIPDKDAVFAELFRVLVPRRTDADRGRHNPESGQRGRATQHRPLDRLNCRSAAGSSVRGAPRTARVRADRDRTAGRHLRTLQVRRHTSQGAEVRCARPTLKAYKPSG